MIKSLKVRESLIRAEHRLLNSIWCNPKLLENTEINSELFIHGIAASIFRSIERLIELGSPFTKDALLQELSDIDVNADENILSPIIAKSAKIDNVNDVIAVLKNGKQRIISIQNLEKAIKEIDSAALSDNEKIEKAKNLISEADLYLTGNNEEIKRIYTPADWVESYDIERQNRRNGKQYCFNNYIFDTLVEDGPVPGNGGIIASHSGSGKSSIALSLINDLIESDIPAMYFSLEMGKMNTMDRLISQRTGIPYQLIANPKDSTEFDQVNDQIESELTKLKEHTKLRFCENANLSLSDIQKHILKFQNDISQDYCIVIFDLISMVSDFMKTAAGANMAQMIEIAINRLNAMAKQMNFHWLALLQLGRESEKEKANCIADLKKFRPQRVHIKNAQAYLERSRYTILPFREKYFAEQFLEPAEYAGMDDIIELQLAKASNSDLIKVSAMFEPTTFSITPFIS